MHSFSNLPLSRVIGVKGAMGVFVHDAVLTQARVVMSSPSTTLSPTICPRRWCQVSKCINLVHMIRRVATRSECLVPLLVRLPFFTQNEAFRVLARIIILPVVTVGIQAKRFIWQTKWTTKRIFSCWVEYPFKSKIFYLQGI